jgi:ribosomal protein S28E/S33
MAGDDSIPSQIVEIIGRTGMTGETSREARKLSVR